MRSGWYGLALAIIVLGVVPSFGVAQEEGTRRRAVIIRPGDEPEGDPKELLEEAREAQIKLESFRESRIPPESQGLGGQCDEMIGRMCLRFSGGEDDAPIRAEPPEMGMARAELLRTLGRAHRALPKDAWVLGQFVVYLSEDRNFRAAEGALEDCETEAWWCDALGGYVFQVSGRHELAAEAFERALAAMPDDEARFWHSVDYLLDSDGRDAFKKSDREEALTTRLWVLGDPLYLVPGNDRLTEHYARKVLIRVKEDAANAFGIEWENDLEQLTTRYGGEVAWERGRGRADAGPSVVDDRHIIGRHHPKSQEYLPPGRFVDRPGDIPPGEWELASDEPRTGFAPAYAPDIDGLYSQVVRFRRGDSLLVVAAFQPAPRPIRVADENGRLRLGPQGQQIRRPQQNDRTARAGDPFGEGREQSEGTFDAISASTKGLVETALFLVTPDGAIVADVRTDVASGVLTALAPNGQYIVGVEVFNEDLKHAWRTRHGASQSSILPDLATASDLAILDGSGDLPETLDEAIPRTLPGVRVRPGERVTLAWEVYGLRVGDRATVAIGLNEGRPSLLRRAGQFLRVVEPDTPVVVSFEQGGPESAGTVFRSVRMDVPELEAGEYTLNVEIQLPGRAPIVISRSMLIL